MDALEEQLSFHYELGQAITEWADVEFALAWTAASCFRVTDRRRAVIGFLSIDNFRAKLQYVNALIVERNLPESDMGTWATYLDRASKLSQKRNRLAHSWVLYDLEQRAGRRVMLVSEHAQYIESGIPSGAWCVRDIAGIGREFVALWRALTNFHTYLRGAQELLPEYPEPPPHPPKLHELRRRIYAFASRPPRPSRE